jgi:hypothetical protein
MNTRLFSTLPLAITGYLNLPFAGEVRSRLFMGATGVNDYEGMRFEVEEAPQHGKLEMKPDGNFIYTPNTGFHGLDAFEWRVVLPSGKVRYSVVGITIKNSTPPNRISTGCSGCD